ncbi:hypothetical protein [Cryptosporidium hominis TU502]|uniref:hypothetical protein n=1 Tax=Cryptosporidium hominis (strain TU502) TaxID=353151 RepID=UPI00004529E6|nr:hypothetical protein [Cryptosporidium hominis TU502]
MLVLTHLMQFELAITKPILDRVILNPALMLGLQIFLKLIIYLIKWVKHNKFLLQDSLITIPLIQDKIPSTQISLPLHLGKV